MKAALSKKGYEIYRNDSRLEEKYRAITPNTITKVMLIRQHQGFKSCTRV